MRKTVTTRYDVAEHLRTPEEMAAYLEACLDEADGDAAFIAKALGDIARAKGMSQVARDTGLSRESLYKALSGDRTPGFDTILKVVAALGLRLHAAATRGTKPPGFLPAVQGPPGNAPSFYGRKKAK
jgi:probable addiction module antidote protein